MIIQAQLSIHLLPAITIGRLGFEHNPNDVFTCIFWLQYNVLARFKNLIDVHREKSAKMNFLNVYSFFSEP